MDERLRVIPACVVEEILPVRTTVLAGGAGAVLGRFLLMHIVASRMAASASQSNDWVGLSVSPSQLGL